MQENEISAEISRRIERDLVHCNGHLPKGQALAWSGYIAALFEWQMLSAEHYDLIRNMLPDVKDDPALRILLDRPPKDCSDPG